jgi:hypothetical protein
LSLVTVLFDIIIIIDVLALLLLMVEDQIRSHPYYWLMILRLVSIQGTIQFLGDDCLVRDLERRILGHNRWRNLTLVHCHPSLLSRHVFLGINEFRLIFREVYSRVSIQLRKSSYTWQFETIAFFLDWGINIKCELSKDWASLSRRLYLIVNREWSRIWLSPLILLIHGSFFTSEYLSNNALVN